MTTNGIHSIEKNSKEKNSIVEKNIDEPSPKKQDNKKHFAEFVSMTNVEYEKLVNTHGKDFADQCIVALDNYKGANGKEYDSDYRAILSWVINKVKNDSKNSQKSSKKNNAYKNYEQRTYDNLDNLYAN